MRPRARSGGKVNELSGWRLSHSCANLQSSLANAWNAHEIAPRDFGSPVRATGFFMLPYEFNVRSLQIAGMWFFLGPLIILLGTMDVLTNGRSRNWLSS